MGITAPMQPAANCAEDQTHPIAAFRAASKRCGDVLAADTLDLGIDPSELLSFLGPSGCGKTKALRVHAGL